MSFHIEAKQGEIAGTVLLPGDPVRAQYIANEYLSDVKCYNQVRGMFGFTGQYKGCNISVQGTGMGMPSLAVYATELIVDYHVHTLIRVGTCGAIQPALDLRKIILATSASGDSGILYRRFHGLDFSAAPDFNLLVKAYQVANELGIDTIQGAVFSTDTFYEETPDRWKVWVQHGVLAVEMETQMLYALAARHRAKAMAILTVTDSIPNNESLTSEDKETSLDEMIQLALETAVRLQHK